MLNNLPTIIDAPGKYLMRNGEVAEVHEVSNNPDPLTTAFCAKGTVKVERKRARYEIWHISGRRGVVGESQRDIISKV